MERLIKGLIVLTQAGAAVGNRPSAKQAGGAVFCAALAGFALAAALGAAVAALWICLLSYLEPAETALVMAGILGVVGAVLAFAAFRLMKSKKVKEDEVDPELEALLAEGLRIYKEHKGLLLAAALVGGIIKGADRRD